ncbi:MAG: DUF3108 domain-containing protein [Candidatus Omnitrophica bacterium]|nr:DUF3108 domain-containing protein [Candidatus Omnitrophota bacterium]
MSRLKSKKIIKFAFLICLLIITVLIFCKSRFFQAEDLLQGFKTKFEQIYNSENPFKDGEKLMFRVKLGFLTIGRSQLIFQGKTKLDEKEVYLIKFTTKTTSFNDTETIYAELDSFLPLKVERDIRMLGKKINITEEYNQEKKMVTITRTEGAKTTKEIIKSDSQLNSILCLIYFYRLPGNIELGKTLSINLPLKKIRLKVKDIQELDVPAGEFDAFLLESEPKGYNFWFDTSISRLPLSIDGAIKFGNARLLLEDFN